MGEVCPNCGRRAGYLRTKTGDLRCRVCGTVWAVEDTHAVGVKEEPAPVPSAPGRVRNPWESLPDEIATVLHARAEALASDAEEEASAAARIAVVSCRIRDEWYALDARDVREILNEFKIFDVPCTPEHILGIVSLRGEILSVTDPAVLMGLERDGGANGSGVLVVCETPDISGALIFDEVLEMVEVDESSMEPPLSTFDRRQAEISSACISIKDRLVTILDLRKVLTPVGAAGD